MRKRLLYFRKSVALGQTKILGSIFSGKDNCVFWRNVTRCYAKKLVVQTFSVLLSHYYRITIAHKCLCNTSDLPCRCSRPKVSIFRTSKKGFKSSTFALTFVSYGCTNAMRSDEDSLRRHRALLGSTKHRYNSTHFFVLSWKNRH